jgi:periplasmic divalent cation tolerance protein
VTDKILIFVTCASMVEGETIGKALLEKKLIACANVGARLHSYYVWKGEHQESTEYQLLLKTTLDKYAEVEAAVRRLHSYEVPEIIAIRIELGSAPYLKWIDDSVGRT